MREPNIDNYINLQDYFEDLDIYLEERRYKRLKNTGKMIAIVAAILIIIKLIK